MLGRKGRYRWRTRLRGRLPWFIVDLGVTAKGRRDCGDHEWYNHDGRVERCYHCRVGERSRKPVASDGNEDGRSAV
jgi:hypothetical protein